MYSRFVERGDVDSSLLNLLRAASDAIDQKVIAVAIEGSGIL